MSTEDEVKKNSAPTNRKPQKRINISHLWLMLIVVYIFLFSSIGYIAFWEQDFNDPEKFLIKYEILREKHFKVLGSSFQDLNLATEDKEFNDYINEFMKIANDTAGDLQELATQSFNIVLGALLAFLSATATMIFQDNNKKQIEDAKDK